MTSDDASCKPAAACICVIDVKKNILLTFNCLESAQYFQKSWMFRACKSIKFIPNMPIFLDVLGGKLAFYYQSDCYFSNNVTLMLLSHKTNQIFEFFTGKSCWDDDSVHTWASLSTVWYAIGLYDARCLMSVWMSPRRSCFSVRALLALTTLKYLVEL